MQSVATGCFSYIATGCRQAKQAKKTSYQEKILELKKAYLKVSGR